MRPELSQERHTYGARGGIIMDIGINGDSAVALAWKQVDPDVCAAYPITPQTIIVERFSDFVADGEVETEFVTAESEHSAMSICIGAASAGARTVTATASAGMAYMWETLGIAAGMRVPITMAVANRALSAPINIHCDHSDVMSARDLGWILIFAENVQEAYDNAIMAMKIAEHPDVRLPVMHNLDGFILSHAIERMSTLETHTVKNFVGEYKSKHSLLDIEHPITHGAMDQQDYYFEHKYQLAEAMQGAIKVIEDVFEEFGSISGRKYDLLEPYRCDDAEYVSIVIGSTAGTIKEAVDQLREEGHKVGSIKVRVYRPFPTEMMSKLLEGKKAAAVLDRHMAIGSTGPMFGDVCATAIDLEKPPELVNYIYGLGGRDVPVSDLKKVYMDMIEGNCKKVNYLGVRI